MYVPRHHHWAFPVLCCLTGFAIHNRFPTWDGSFVLIVLGIVSIEWGAWLWQAGVLYQGYLTQIDIRHTTTKEEMPTEAKDTIPVIKVGGVPFETVTTLPKFDKERSFAVTVLRMMEYGGKADMRESKWVNPKKFSRSEFVAMLKNWEAHQIIKREAERKNAPYVVVSVEAVRLIANGNPLPRRDTIQ